MTDSVSYLRGVVQQHVDADGLTQSARRWGVGIGQVRSICSGRAPLSTTIERLCDALDMEFYVGPPRRPENVVIRDHDIFRAAPGGATARPAPRHTLGPPEMGMAPVHDARVARLLADLSDACDELPSEDRARLVAAITSVLDAAAPHRTRPETRRVVGWLGWRVVDGMMGRDVSGTGE